MSDRITCYIIDDEPLARKIMQDYTSKVSFLELIGVFGNPLEATGRIKEDKPDLLFLDINMPDIDGLTMISMLNPRPMIILTTAYDQYALKAYELEVRDYFLKPISFDRFYKGVLRLYQEKISSGGPIHPVENSSDKDFIFLKAGYRIQKIALKDILFIEGMRDYLRVNTTKEKVMALLSFSKMEALLPADNFVRVHKSYIVALDKIDHIEKNRIKIGDSIIPVGETFRPGFYKKINAL